MSGEAKLSWLAQNKGKIVKAVTVWQPWASLIAAGVKPYEFRGWVPPRSMWGDRIAIHAGARKVKRDELQDLVLRLRGNEAWTTCLKPAALELLEGWLTAPARLPLSSVVATVTLGTPILSRQIVAEFGGVMNDSDRGQHSNWAWPMLDVEPLEPISPAQGAQGFWTWKVAA